MGPIVGIKNIVSYLIPIFKYMKNKHYVDTDAGRQLAGPPGYHKLNLRLFRNIASNSLRQT